MPHPSDIAVVGMACKFPHARDLNELWRVVKEGEVTFEEIPAERWNHQSFFDATDVRNADKTYVRKGAFIEGHKEFAALHYGLAPRRVQVMDPQQRLLIEAVRQATQDAGYESKPLDKANAGVFFGISANEHRDTLSARMRVQELIDGHYGDKLSAQEAEAVKAAVADVAPMRAFTIAGNLLNMSAAAVSQTFDFGGPSFTIDAACSSALVAIHEAVVNLRAGQCNVAFAGGVYLNLHPDNLVGFARIGAISPSGICRPFDARADGFVMGEGVGVVVLKRFEDAQRDSDRVYAVIKGSGCNNDGRGDGPMTPRPEGQMEAMARAHRQTEFPVESIGLVETHGTATTVGDVVEVGALKRFFEERAGHHLEPYCYLSSIKANVGHTMSAAGVAGFIKATLALYHRTIPPQPSCEELNPKLELEHSPFKIAREATAWNAKGPRRAAVSSFGFGGTNAHVLLEEGAAQGARRAEEGERHRPQLFLLSAPTPTLLAAYAKSIATEVERTQPTPASVAATLLNRAAFDARLALTAATRDELIIQLRSAADAIIAAPNEPRSGPEFAFSPKQGPAPKVAFLFPGQGAQRVGLLREVIERVPAIRERLAQLDAAAKADAGTSLLDALYPRAPYDAAAAQQNLTRTEVCQPAMAALGIALGEWLRSLGLEPHALLGHSLGEFAAASVAGMLTGEEAVKLVARRGQLMNALKLADNGAMLAVMADRSAVEAALAGIEGAWLANLNHPTQVVVSGTTAGIEAAQDRMSERGLKSTRLDVSHAFHSPLMKGVDAGMRKLVNALEVHNPNARVVSCISGRIYADVAEAKDIWVKHATAPVDFVAAVKACDADVFVQVGAGGALLSFARGAGTGSFHSLGATEGGDEAATLFNTLGQLFVRGAPLKTAALASKQAQPVPLPPTPLETQTYWPVERPKQRAPRQQLAAPSLTRPAGAIGGAHMDNMVALFREQMALMQSQAEILRAQAAALQALAGGDPAALAQLSAAPSAVATPPPPPAAVIAKPPNFSNLVAKKDPSPQQGEGARRADEGSNKIQPAPVATVSDAETRKEVETKILASVARISAFPPDTLKAEQTLVGELGFDSLMLVELDGDVAKGWPQLGGLPRELFNKNTTVATLVDHITQALVKGVSAPAAPAVDEKKEAPKLYAPAAAKRELSSLAEAAPRLTGTVRITPDSHGLGQALVRALGERGVKAELATADIPGEFHGAVQLCTHEGDYRAASREALALAKKLGDSPELFVTVTALGGRFGLDGVADDKLGQAGAAAFARSLAQEWPEAQVKSIDVDLGVGIDTLALAIAEEIVSSNRAPEVGFTAHGRVEATLALVAEGPRADEFTQLNAASVVLVTGGAKGVGLQLATAVAKRYRCTVALGGRSADSQETQKAIAQVKAAGAKTCAYFALDARSASSVQSAAAAIRKAFGTLDAVVHAAGVLADARVGNKDVAQVDAVLETKVEGARALLALPNLKLFAGVGSWAGRFGNAAQTDYAAANAMLAAATRKRIGLRAVTIDFPPWEDSAMAKKIPSFMRQEMLARGVTFLSADEGVAVFLEALESGSGEVLVARRVPDAGVTQRGSFAVSRLNHVYLNDHQMNGQRVMPLASALDYVAEAAVEAGVPSTGFTVEHFSLERPVLVPDTTWLDVAVRPSHGAFEVTLSQGPAVSYRGTVKPQTGTVIAAKPLAPTPALPLSLREFYDGFTFHGPRLQGIQSIEALADDGVSGWVKGCRPADWIKDSKRDAWTVDPLIIDSSFQLAGYWAWTKQQRAGFPLGFDRFTQFAPFGAGPVKCTATFAAQDGDVFKGTLVWQDQAGKTLAVMEGAKAEFKKRDPQFSAAAKNEPAAKPVDPATYDFSKFPEYEELQERIQMAEAFGLKNPYFSVQEGICGATTVVDGKLMKNFSSYNYVGNSGDPKVSRAAKDAIEKYGTSVSASRVASGERPLTRELEKGLARFFGTEDAIVLVSGHATNVTVIGHVVGPGDLILHDALAHDSIIGGAKLSGAKRRPFPHNDFEALERTLQSLRPHYRRVLICIEGTYSMDGDIPDLPKFIEVKKKYGALLLVDEAHSAGVIGKNGRGIGEYHDVNRADVDMWMGTLSKSFASCGGYICGTHALVEYLKYTTPGFVYSVGISPPNAAAALASLQNLEAEPWRPQKAVANAKLFAQLLKERGVDTGMARGESAVVPAIIGNSVLCLQLSDRLKQRGINVQPILYPAVEEHLARLRFFLSSLHTEQQLKETAETVAEELHSLRQQMEADAVA